MCTLIVAHRMFEGFPVVVAANRDELLDRRSEIPLLRGSKSQILAPKDLQRGGSWIGVNKHGVFVGLTNRMSVKSKTGKTSRGAIVMNALEHTSALRAFEDSKFLKGELLNGFHMIIADKDNLFLLRGDGQKIEYSSRDGQLLIVTNHGVNNISATDNVSRIIKILKIWKEKGISKLTPTPANLNPLLGIHGDWLHGTCINIPVDNYGTKSSCIIRLNADSEENRWQYWHRERNSLDHICVQDFNKMLELPIQS